MKKITVITADVINSRKNLGLINNLPSKLKQISEFPVICEFTMSRGDEIQGVVEGWLTAPQVIRNLRDICRPLKLKIGIGIGNVVESDIRNNPWDMSGRAFYLARTALERVENNEGFITFLNSGFFELDEFINSVLLLIDAIQHKWTDKQWEAVQSYIKTGTFRESAKLLGLSMQGVEKRCKTAQWKQIKHAENILSKTEAFIEKFKGEIV